LNPASCPILAISLYDLDKLSISLSLENPCVGIAEALVVLVLKFGFNREKKSVAGDMYLL